MSNYYLRKDGLWYICDGKHKLKCEFSGSMEIAYQQGRDDVIKAILNNKIKPCPKAMANIKKCEKSLKKCQRILNKLETDLFNQPKPSEAMGYKEAK